MRRPRAAAVLSADAGDISGTAHLWAASGALSAVYVFTLGAAYARGGVSTVYPIARGSGLTLTALLSGPLLGERMSATGAAGVAGVTLGVVLIGAASAGSGAPWWRRCARAWRGEAAEAVMPNAAAIAASAEEVAVEWGVSPRLLPDVDEQHVPHDPHFGVVLTPRPRARTGTAGSVCKLELSPAPRPTPPPPGHADPVPASAAAADAAAAAAQAAVQQAAASHPCGGRAARGAAYLAAVPDEVAAVALAVVTGVLIAAYSLVDKLGVARAGPIAYADLLYAVTGVCMAPIVLGWRREELADALRTKKRAILLVGAGNILTYVLVLFAMQARN